MDWRKYVVSIAGFDPSAGAGVLSDVKCFEQHKVYGFGICSALTVQSDDRFIHVEWMNADQIVAQLEQLLCKFEISACKIGLVKDVLVLQQVINYLRMKCKGIKLILDPVLRSSSGFRFHTWKTELLISVLKQLDLITPNYEELSSMGHEQHVEQTALHWSKYCPVLLKGGHNIEKQGYDLLFVESQLIEFKPNVQQVFEKHGSGCVLSASITANLALGHSLADSCALAKVYITKFLSSNQGLLGYHHND